MIPSTFCRGVKGGVFICFEQVVVSRIFFSFPMEDVRTCAAGNIMEEVIVSKKNTGKFSRLENHGRCIAFLFGFQVLLINFLEMNLTEKS